MGDDGIFARTAANRRRAADLFAVLDRGQWRTMSLCAGWTVREVAGRLLLPLELSMPRFLIRLAMAHGDVARTTDQLSRELGRLPTEEIVDTLRAKADARSRPPGVGSLGPMSDSCIRLRDAARPLGLNVDAPLDDWRLVLDFLTSPAAAFGFVTRGRLRGLAFRATDQDWNRGDGAEVAGSSEALALAMSGRDVALADLTGAGVATLAARSG